MSSPYSSLVQRSLDLAAGTRVDAAAYEDWNINLSKLQRLGKCYREGWLHNVLGRITPITTPEMDDYLMMADMFVASKSDAKYLCAVLNRSLATFAAVAGINTAQSRVVPLQLGNHVALYEKIADMLGEKFAFSAAAPFTASTTLNREVQGQIPYIRSFLQRRFA